MKKFVIAFLTTYFCTSCMYSPKDGESINSRVEDKYFNGLINTPNKRIDLQIYDYSTQTWKTFDTVYSSNTPFITVQGQTWYSWVKTSKMPRTSKYWPSSQSGLGKVRAFSGGSTLYTGDQNLWTCAISQVGNGMSYTDAYQFCDQTNGQMKEVHLLGNCDVIKNGGCYDSFNITDEKNWPLEADNIYTDTIQGITQDSNYWYMTSTAYKGSLMVYNKSTGNLSFSPDDTFNNSSMLDNGIREIFSPGWHHPGDLDYSNGWLYVALEKSGQSNGNASSNAIGAIPVDSFRNKNTYLTFPIIGGPQISGGNFPWIARDPGTDYFYSSLFENTNKLQRYKAYFDQNGKPISFVYCGEVNINNTLNYVQGGSFSPSGRLYISSDARSSSDKIIKVIDLKGSTVGFEPIDCSNPPTISVDVIKGFDIKKDYGSFLGARYEEVEGISVYDLSSNSTPSPNSEGSIHVILVNKEVSNDRYWLKHLKVDKKENL